MKTCRDCKKEKPIEDFVKNKVFKDGFDTLCKMCNRKRVKSWRKKNPEKRKEQLKRESKKVYSYSKRYRWTFGCTIQDYNELFENQKGCCAICGKHQSEFSKRLSVDHCHTTQKIRGLLCSNCNFILGLAKDNQEILFKAIKYLNK